MLESILHLALILILGGAPEGAVSRDGFFLTALPAIVQPRDGDGELPPGGSPHPRQRATTSMARSPLSAPHITLLESVVKTQGQSVKDRGRFTSSELQPSPSEKKNLLASL